jgi:pimeloyl-ACP methyl ester carboxylesterase
MTRKNKAIVTEDLARYCHPGAAWSQRMHPVDGSVSIRTIRFTPATPTVHPTIVLVVGLTTVLESFRGMLIELTRDHEVCYVETREKPSSQVARGTAFNMEAFGKDVAAAITHEDVADGRYLLAGFSLGATAIIHGYQDLPCKPSGLVLAEPVPAFRFPWWSMPVAQVAAPLYGIVKPMALWYLRNFRIDSGNDEEIMRITERALNSADPYKLLRTVRSINGYEAWQRIPLLDRHTLLIATSKDSLHVHDDITRMAALLPSCEMVDLENNTRSHAAEMGALIRAFHTGRLQ